MAQEQITGRWMNRFYIERARPEQAALLTQIAFSAKRVWGYPESWIQEWSPGLTITAALISADHTYVGFLEKEPAGFYSLHEIDSGLFFLEHLWIVPNIIKSGIGRLLFQHACQLARSSGAIRVKIESDPNAEGFYLRMGAKRIGTLESTVEHTARSIPLLEVLL